VQLGGRMAAELIGDPATDRAAGALGMFDCRVESQLSGGSQMPLRTEVAEGTTFAAPMLIVRVADPAADTAIARELLRGAAHRLSALTVCSQPSQLPTSKRAEVMRLA
jgi:hypothetical protein